jgi:hypothetical protein
MKLAVTQLTTASASELRRAAADVGPLPVPTLTMRWRGRATVRVLDGQFSAEIMPAGDGRNELTCRYRFGGPFSWLVGKEDYERLRGNLQYFAALVCHRAERVSGSRYDGRPPPSRRAGRPAAAPAREAGIAAAGHAPIPPMATSGRGVGEGR